MTQENIELSLTKHEAVQLEAELSKPAHIIEGLAELVLRVSIDNVCESDVPRPLWTRRQDHGTSGNKMFNNPKGWNKTKIDKLEDIIDSELDEQAVDFDQWEDEINANNTPADANEASVVYSVSGTRKTSKYDYLLGDLEKLEKLQKK